VVDTTLNGNAQSLKAYNIAVGALGRPPGFDPIADASVRVHAQRLRSALSEYYASEAVPNEIQIDIPRGSYVPEFRSGEAGTAESGDPAARQESRSGQTRVLVAQCRETAHRVEEIRREIHSEFLLLRRNLTAYTEMIVRLSRDTEF